MNALRSDSALLGLLNGAQPDRPWGSCAEQRQCTVCERVFRGRSVTVLTRGRLKPSLGCPGCGSAPALWARLGNPLTDEIAWKDWQVAMENFAALDGAEERGSPAVP